MDPVIGLAFTVHNISTDDDDPRLAETYWEVNKII
jgi:hypothetical protein